MPGTDEPTTPQSTTDSIERLLIIRLGERLYGFKPGEVDHVAPFVQPVRVPTAPGYCLGVVHLRGRLVTALDLTLLLSSGIGAGAWDSDARLDEGERRLVVLEAEGLLFAIVADAVLGFSTSFAHEEAPIAIDALTGAGIVETLRRRGEPAPIERA